MKKIIIGAAMAKTITDTLDGYSDDKVKSFKFVSKAGINLTYEVETDMEVDALCAYVKKLIKSTPTGSALYFTVKAA